MPVKGGGGGGGGGEIRRGISIGGDLPPMENRNFLQREERRGFGGDLITGEHIKNIKNHKVFTYLGEKKKQKPDREYS